jgi:S-adenosylmethionine:diacylglycerol 3-amino-3-carboxypropyl transferase
LRENLLARLSRGWFILVFGNACGQTRTSYGNTNRIFGIFPADCNLLNYLTHELERILAAGLNTANLTPTRLQIAVLRHQPSRSFLPVFGVGKGT